MMYTFAQAPKYDLSDPKEQLCLDNAQLLVAAVVQNDHIARMKGEADELAPSLADTTKKLDALEETLAKIRKVIPAKQGAAASS